MAAWSGWENDFLNAAGVPTSSANRRFLDQWASHAETDCGNNPLDLTHSIGRSTDCASLPTLIPKAQHYSTHAEATGAFIWQLDAAGSTQILKALKSGNPYTVGNTGVVAEEIANWGSVKFSQFYFGETGNAPGRGGGGGQIHAPHALEGWGDVQRSVNVHLRRTLKDSNRYTVRALQSLSRARKVRL